MHPANDHQRVSRLQTFHIILLQDRFLSSSYARLSTLQEYHPRWQFHLEQIQPPVSVNLIHFAFSEQLVQTLKQEALLTAT